MSFLLFIAWIAVVVFAIRWAMKPRDRRSRIAPPATFDELARAEAKLDSGDAEQVLQGALQIARRRVERAAVLHVRESGLDLVLGSGLGLEGRTLEGIRLADGDESVLREPLGGQMYRGRPARGGADERLFAALELGEGEVAICPLSISGQVIALLYAEKAGELDPGALVALWDLSARASSGLSRALGGPKTKEDIDLAWSRALRM
jgi:hypothetical protein